MNKKTEQYDLMSETGIIGCILIQPDLADKINLPPEAFGDLRNRELYTVLQRLWHKYKNLDVITVNDYLTKKGLLDSVGGFQHISACQDSVPSAANLDNYVGIVSDKYKRRKLSETGNKLSKMASDDTNLQDILFIAETDLADLIGDFKKSDLPEIVPANQFIEQRLEQPVEVIHGILHRGSKMAIGGASKSYKTWTLLDIAISVSTGSNWLDFETTVGKVLFLNFEIQSYSWQNRLKLVADAKFAPSLNENLHLLNLRGHACDFRQLIPKIIDLTMNRDYSLIVLDPIYKIYGQTDENSACDTAELLNALERLSSASGAAIAFGAHFAKGNASGKNAIDRISGSGVFARDPDSILVFTEHEAESAFTIEPILRNFARVPPFAVRWNFPLMTPVDLDPSKLKQPGKKKKHSASDILAAIQDRDESNPITIPDWAKLLKTSPSTLKDYLEELRNADFIKTIGEGNRAKQSITSKGRAYVNENA